MKLDWDPEIDTPATVAVIGGGPVGVEAALYARFLGYFVMLFDARRVGSRLVRWCELPMNVPFGEAASSLGLAALEAQDTNHELPELDAVISYREFIEKYVTPVAKSDLLEDCVHINSPITSISRAHWWKHRPDSIEDRAEDEFRLLADSKVRGEFTQLADIILDCSGDGRWAAGIGPGGGMAIGQHALQNQFELGPRDLIDKDRDKFVGKHAVQFGCGPVACHNAIQFLTLANDNAQTKLTWVVPKGTPRDMWLKQVAAVSSDLAIAVSQVLTGDHAEAIHIDAWGAEAIARDASGKWKIKLLVGDEETAEIEADVVMATELGDSWRFANGLCIELCPKGRLTVAANHWLASQTTNELRVTPSSFLTTEPHYYVLGRKSVGGDTRFNVTHARQQIQQVFGLIGGRSDLDVYQTVS